MALRFLLPHTLGRTRAGVRAELLAESLTRHLGCPITCEVAASYDALERGVLDSEVDLAWAPPLVCARVAPQVRTLFRVLRAGRSTYRAALVGRRDDGHTIPSLFAIASASGRGQLRVAWVDPRSLGGHLLAADLLRRRGVPPRRLFAEQQFLGSYRDALTAVIEGRADLASLWVGDADESLARAALAEQVGAAARVLGVVDYSDPSPNDALIVTRRSAPGDAAMLIARLVPTSRLSAPSFLLEALDADGLVEAPVAGYLELERLAAH